MTYCKYVFAYLAPRYLPIEKKMNEEKCNEEGLPYFVFKTLGQRKVYKSSCDTLLESRDEGTDFRLARPKVAFTLDIWKIGPGVHSNFRLGVVHKLRLKGEVIR